MKKLFFICLMISYNLLAQNWKLVWSDEFNGTSINPSYWTFETGTGTNGWGNNELQYYTNRTENAKIENGMLVITARQESYAGRNFTSARMKTQGKKSFKYGKIEARMKLPVGKGSWPAFWMLGDNITFVGWPKCGEIDIMEHINSDPSVYGTIHYDDNGHVSKGGNTSTDVTQFHVYSIEWDSNTIKWFVDGRQYYFVYIVNGVNSTEEFHNPFFIILNLAIGGNWPGNPDGSMQFPISMYVDYVRVYELVTDVEKIGTEISNEFELEQNFPNPFSASGGSAFGGNPSTTIKYSIPAVILRQAQDDNVMVSLPVGRHGTSNHDNLVTLKVYDILGREVATLVNEHQPAGNYEVKFDGSNLSSGIYFYRLQSGSFVQTKKFLLMK
ncbi:family 16 glycosylhydrolase [Stygiobacter electus]|uniref:Family 16 glycosylhydrolase n=1 Tax=Stygiobacter electus TaxID=3032292 RepID=A0AAE3P2D3_9BACT|nr:family 16 glycosylhydrolase [Stygiobacter electus]MDF1612819.1 family 16 glycosylhydrolase [Stygiobacter electus]